MTGTTFSPVLMKRHYWSWDKKEGLREKYSSLIIRGSLAIRQIQYLRKTKRGILDDNQRLVDWTGVVRDHTSLNHPTCLFSRTPLQANVTRGSVYPTELRFRREYVLWYKNVFEFLAKGWFPHTSFLYITLIDLLSGSFPAGIVPLAALVYLNYQVFAVIRRRRQLEHR